MDVLHACCAGLGVYRKTVVTCVRRVEPAVKVAKRIETFATMTADLQTTCNNVPGKQLRRVFR
jgi:hypothetical protein